MRAASKLTYGLMIGLFTVAAANAATVKPETTGRLLARSACSYCHVVTEDQGFAPPLRPQGPDFLAIAANRKNSAKQLRRFLLTTHKDVANSAGMPNPLLTNKQIDNIVGFILSQRGEP
jgi:mono/diheme cytochrome c family protein